MVRFIYKLTIGVALALALNNVGLASGHAPSPEHHGAGGEASSGVEARGVDLGEYKIRAYYPVEAQKSTVWFVLHAPVATEHMAEARRVVENRQHKLRDEIITASRMAPLSVYDEPGLSSFRRRILARLRRTLPELKIDDVYVSDFQITVKSL